MPQSMIRHKQFINELARVNFGADGPPQGTLLSHFHRGVPHRRLVLAELIKEFRAREKAVSAGLLIG